MASDQLLRKAESLLGKALPASASSADDGTVAEFVLTEIVPNLDTQGWSADRLMGAVDMLVYQRETQQTTADSSEIEDSQLLARIKAEYQENWRKPLSSSRSQYV